MDIRKRTCVIIRRNGEYLVGRNMTLDGLKWSIYAYDAWRTRNIETARDVARSTGGVMVLFNPIVNQQRVL